MRSLRLAAAAAALTLVLAACGSSSSSSSSSSTPTGGGVGATSSGGSGGGKTVAVTLKDFSITIAGGNTLSPGAYTFDVTNKGPSSHNLTITGPGANLLTINGDLASRIFDVTDFDVSTKIVTRVHPAISRKTRRLPNRSAQRPINGSVTKVSSPPQR